MLYKEWIEKWLALYIKPSVKIRTYEKYEQLSRSHIIPFLGEKEINDLSAIKLQEFVNGPIAKNLKSSTVNLVITVLRKSIKAAVFVGVANIDDTGKIVRPKAEQTEIECFSTQEQERIEEYIIKSGKDKLFGILLCFYTGLRIGELLALEWNDIDLSAGTITINKSCHYGKDGSNKYGRITETPKTISSRRLIPIPKQLMSWIKRLYKNRQAGTVIASKGKPIAVRSYQRTFEKILKRLNIPHRGFHALRHTFATRAIECGIDVKTLSELLGHKNPTVTLSRYAHSLMEHKTEMMNKLGKSLAKYST